MQNVIYSHNPNDAQLISRIRTIYGYVENSGEFAGNYVLGDGRLSKYIFDGGYIDIASGLNTAAYRFYVRDHLGSVRVVLDDDGNVLQQLYYHPFGGVWGDAGTDTGLQPWKYSGKEYDHRDGLDLYDYGARLYDPAGSRWTSPDPLCEKYCHISPYAFCNNNPINNIDPDGRDWYEAVNKEIRWTDFTNQKELNDNEITGRYLGKAVIVMNGSLEEKLGKGDNLFGEGAKLATTTVYGPNGEKDIQNYDSFTMTSDFSVFGAIEDGEYNVQYKIPGKSGALKSNWAVNGTAPVDCINGINPSPISPYSKTQKNGVYIHSSNRNGFAGKFYHKGGTNSGKLKGAVSTGGLLIVPSRYDDKGNPLNNGWDQFNQQLKGLKKAKLILNRQ